MKRAWVVLPLIAFLALAWALASGIGKDPSRIPSPLIGKPAPEFSLPLLSSPQTQLGRDDLLGQPYLLNVWGSWCPGCRVEHGLIARIAETGLVPVYGLNFKDETADAQRWLAQFGDPYAANLVDADGRVGIDFGVYGAPETFLIDAQGTIRYKYVGPMDVDEWQQRLRPLIYQVLQEAGA